METNSTVIPFSRPATKFAEDEERNSSPGQEAPVMIDHDSSWRRYVKKEEKGGDWINPSFSALGRLQGNQPSPPCA